MKIYLISKMRNGSTIKAKAINRINVKATSNNSFDELMQIDINAVRINIYNVTGNKLNPVSKNRLHNSNIETFRIFAAIN